MSKTAQVKSKETDFPTPGKEERKVFIAALGIAKSLLDNGSLRIDVDNRGMTELEIASKALNELPKDSLPEGLTHKQLEEIISTEIGSLVQAGTHQDPIKGLQFSVPDNILEKVGTEEFLWRLDETRKLLLSEEFLSRVLFLRTATAFVLGRITWQIVSKRHDADAGELKNIIGALVKISYNRPDSSGMLRLAGKGFSLELPTMVEPKEITLELHKSDIDKMIKALEEAKKHLAIKG
jgi:hypothetical protein